MLLLAVLLLPPLVLLANLLGGFWGAAAVLWAADGHHASHEATLCSGPMNQSPDDVALDKQ